MLAERMPHLRELEGVYLECHPTVAGSALLRFPAQLRTLRLDFVSAVGDDFGDADAALELPPGAVEAIAQLPQLTELRLAGDGGGLPPLLTALAQRADSQLRSLDLSALNDSLPTDALPALSQMVQLHELMPTQSFSWSALLQPGHRMQLRTIRAHASQADCAALATLPTLTDVTLHVEGAVPDASFFSALPLLQRLQVERSRDPPIGAAFVSAALCHCEHLTHLGLSRAFLPPSITDCFQRMAQLRTLLLRYCRGMASLAFLASTPGSSSLTHLLLLDCVPRLPVSELVHLRQLRALQSLELYHVFERETTAEEKADFHPSRLLPALQQLGWR